MTDPDQLAELDLLLADNDRLRELLARQEDEINRLRLVVEGAALSMQTLGQPTLRDNLLGAIGDLQSRIREQP